MHDPRTPHEEHVVLRNRFCRRTILAACIIHRALARKLLNIASLMAGACNVGRRPAIVECILLSCKLTICIAVKAALARRGAERTTLRLGLPSKGRMAEDTQQLLKVSRHHFDVGPRGRSKPMTISSTWCIGHSKDCSSAFRRGCIGQIARHAQDMPLLAGLPAECIQAQPSTIRSHNQPGEDRSCAICAASQMTLSGWSSACQLLHHLLGSASVLLMHPFPLGFVSEVCRQGAGCSAMRPVRAVSDRAGGC